MPKDKRTYITLAVDMPDHPKLATLTKGQCWLIVEALMYCRKYKTDGVIDPAVWRRMDTKRNREAVEQSGLCVDLATESRQNRDRIADEFRQKTGDALPESGVFFFDYAEHQQTRREIEASTEAKKVAGQKGGKARAANAARTSNTLEGASEGQAAACDLPKQVLKQNQAEEEEEKEPTYVGSSPPVSNARTARGRGMQLAASINETARPIEVYRLASEYEQLSATPISPKIRAQIEDAIVPLFGAGIPEEQIMAGIRLWEASDINSPTQLHLFVHKAGAKASAPAKATQSKLSEWAELANEFAAAEATTNRRELA